MNVSDWTESDSAKAQLIWADYRRQHDLTEHFGQTAGIDPVSGRVWLGDSIETVVAQRNADGIDSPLLFERVGSDTYYRKGGHRRLRDTSPTMESLSSSLKWPISSGEPS